MLSEMGEVSQIVPLLGTTKGENKAGSLQPLY